MIKTFDQLVQYIKKNDRGYRVTFRDEKNRLIDIGLINYSLSSRKSPRWNVIMQIGETLEREYFGDMVPHVIILLKEDCKLKGKIEKIGDNKWKIDNLEGVRKVISSINETI